MLNAPMSTNLPPTERRLAASMHLDQASSREILDLLADQDAVAVAAVRAVLDDIAILVDIAAERMRAGGNVHYFGAGTSGRLAVLDAVELRPTYQFDDDRVVPHIAGGVPALTRSVEGAEDDVELGSADAAGIGPNDVAIGIAASGNTPYVRGALQTARSVGAHTALVSSNPDATVAAVADQHILLDTGAEVVTGSTRLKAGTATKLMLNGFSTALMVQLGRTYSNLMVALRASNDKLRKRSLRILSEATGLDDVAAIAALDAARGDLRTAIVAQLLGVDAQTASAQLALHAGSVRHAIDVAREGA